MIWLLAILYNFLTFSYWLDLQKPTDMIPFSEYDKPRASQYPLPLPNKLIFKISFDLCSSFFSRTSIITLYTVYCVCHIFISLVACIIANFYVISCLSFFFFIIKRKKIFTMYPLNLERSGWLNLLITSFLKLLMIFISYFIYSYSINFISLYFYPLFLRFSLEWINNLLTFLRFALEWMANWCLPNMNLDLPAWVT